MCFFFQNAALFKKYYRALLSDVQAKSSFKFNSKHGQFTPSPGDLYIFKNRNLKECEESDLSHHWYLDNQNKKVKQQTSNEGTLKWAINYAKTINR